MTKKKEIAWLNPTTAITTGRAAKICHLSQQTIIRNCDSGALQCHGIPPSNHRRIPLNNLYNFMIEFGLPTGTIDSFIMCNIVVFSTDQTLVEELEHHLPDARPGGFIVKQFTDLKSFLWHPDYRSPAFVIADFYRNLTDALTFCNNIRAETRFADTYIFGLFSGNEADGDSINQHVSMIVPKPLNFTEFTQLIKTHSSQK